MIRLALALLLVATPVRADVAEAVRDRIVPDHAAFAAATADLARAAGGACDAGLRPAYDAAFDAWLGIQHLRLGPAEEAGRALAIAFWPDPKGLGAKAQAALLRARDPAVLGTAAFAEVSVAARGLFGLERLLYPDGALPGGDYPCALVRATAADLARLGAELLAEWRGPFGAALIQADTPRYRSPAEARQALFTQLLTGLDFNAEQRLGRPLGTFDKPRPERSEARAAGRSLRNIAVSLAGLRGLAQALAPDSPRSLAAFDRALATAAALPEPVLAGVADPARRLKIEILRQHIEAVRATAAAEIGPQLGVTVGFNSADGD